MRLIRDLGRVSPLRLVPDHVARPPYVADAGWVRRNRGRYVAPFIHEGCETRELMRRSCRLARRALEYCGSLVRPGVTTDELDAAAHEFIVGSGAYPSPLGYFGYPKSICTSINNVMCHGIPSDSVLEEGDIVNVDVTVYKDGYHGDCSATYLVGEGHSSRVRELVRVAEEARDGAIAVCGPGVPLSYIGHTIKKICARHGFTSPMDLSGHGIGRDFHTGPYILHWENQESGVMESGMTFTVEPVVCMGEPGHVLGEDGWTLFSADGECNAQFEHTILIHESGHEVLTE